ncbi:MAG: class I SAM-dependent methyltransferase [Oscillospiraceae bacterium]|jgi:ubiquinone/menaquinone biosynthesis C-methylase UbiE|nr:class I SAM-dependent methyltransferase [Oscillospiraceae bacterium]
MNYSKEQILEMMSDNSYPLTLKYNPDWILENAMGSHCLWLQESLTQNMKLTPGMRVLDLGCGKAIGSIFLAKEFESQVWAADLRITPSENWKRICDMNCEDKVFPIKADADDLPFADDFFDAMVSINSLFFYATGDGFLREHIFKHIKPGGEIGIVVPSFQHEYTNGLPEKYLPYMGYGIDKYHACAWWETHFLKSNMVEIVLCDTFPTDNNGNELYRKSACIFNAHEEPFNILAWDDITFTRIIARRKP